MIWRVRILALLMGYVWAAAPVYGQLQGLAMGSRDIADISLVRSVGVPVVRSGAGLQLQRLSVQVVALGSDQLAVAQVLQVVNSGTDSLFRIALPVDVVMLAPYYDEEWKVGTFTEVEMTAEGRALPREAEEVEVLPDSMWGSRVGRHWQIFEVTVPPGAARLLTMDFQLRAQFVTFLKPADWMDEYSQRVATLQLENSAETWGMVGSVRFLWDLRALQEVAPQLESLNLEGFAQANAADWVYELEAGPVALASLGGLSVGWPVQEYERKLLFALYEVPKGVVKGANARGASSEQTLAEAALDGNPATAWVSDSLTGGNNAWWEATVQQPLKAIGILSGWNAATDSLRQYGRPKQVRLVITCLDCKPQPRQVLNRVITLLDRPRAAPQPMEVADAIQWLWSSKGAWQGQQRWRIRMEVLSQYPGAKHRVAVSELFLLK